MAKSRTRKLTFANLADSTDAIVLVIDRDFTIRLANPACCDWIDVGKGALVGTRCVYASGELDNNIRNKAQGLCPPPEVFDGASIDGALYATRDKTKIWRQAFFTPFAKIDGCVEQVLVIATSPDLERPPQFEPQHLRLKLHHRLAERRSQSIDRYGMNNLIGESPFAKRLKRQIEAATRSDTDLLIVGPKQSGREHIANTVFFQREQTDTPLITIHCHIADATMIQQRIGEWGIEQKHRPNQGWILLLNVDELGELAQQELLGFSQLPGIQLRTIATSTQSLIELANQGAFNLELAHHLSTFLIETVSLNQRGEDVPLLAQAFLESENSKRAHQLSGFSTAALQTLSEYEWPGNIDQLAQSINSAAENSRSSWIDQNDLPEEIRLGVAATRLGRKPAVTIELDNYLESIERKLISRALKQSKNNKTQASKMLGISRAKLLRRVSHFKLEQDVDTSTQIDAPMFEESEE